jgi:predicted Zn-dependent protease
MIQYSGIFLGIMLAALAQADDDYASLVHKTTWANYLSSSEKKSAEKWYREIIDASTLPYPLRSYSLYLASTGQHRTLLQYKRQLQAAFKDDLEVQKAIAVALTYEKQHGEAEALFMALAAQFPTCYEVVLPAVQVMTKRGEDARARETLEKLLNARPQKQHTSIAMVLLAQLYIKENNLDAAYTLVTQCVAMQPSYAPAWLILGTLEELKQNREKAVNAYRTFCALSPVPIPEVEKRIALLHMSNTQNSGLSLNALQQCMVLIVHKKYDEALQMTRQMLRAQPQDSTIRALHLHLLVTTGSYRSAVALLAHYIAEKPDDYRWWGALHIIALNQEAASVAQATLIQLRLHYPYTVWGYLYEADCALRKNSFKEAYNLYVQAHTIVTDEVIKSELYFMQALCGYELHDYAVVVQAIQNGLALSVIHAPLSNLAAYYYAHTGDYDKAQKMVVQCCALEPQNYHYQDTAAFIAYKKGDLSHAAIIFNALHMNHKDDAAITLHAAQAAHKQHNYTDARTLLAHAENHAYSEYVKRRVQSYLNAGTV